MAALGRKVGQQALAIDFLRGCLQDVEEQRKLQAWGTRGSSTWKRNEAGEPDGMRKLCWLAKVSRAGFHRWRKPATRITDPNLAVRDAIQRIALEFPRYGSRRIGIELGRRGWKLNRKRVQRRMARITCCAFWTMAGL